MQYNRRKGSEHNPEVRTDCSRVPKVTSGIRCVNENHDKDRFALDPENFDKGKGKPFNDFPTIKVREFRFLIFIFRLQFARD